MDERLKQAVRAHSSADQGLFEALADALASIGIRLDKMEFRSDDIDTRDGAWYPFFRLEVLLPVSVRDIRFVPRAAVTNPAVPTEAAPGNDGK